VLSRSLIFSGKHFLLRWLIGIIRYVYNCLISLMFGFGPNPASSQYKMSRGSELLKTVRDASPWSIPLGSGSIMWCDRQVTLDDCNDDFDG